MPDKPVLVSYIPHGVDSNVWKKFTDEKDLEAVQEYRKNLFGESWEDVKFVVLYNSRNIRRKQTADTILAYREFLLGLPEEVRDSCRLVLHTQPIDDNGTDLYAVVRDCAPEINAVFSPARLSPPDMVKLYNNVDVVINLASNEGFGIGTLEAIMTERMIIANVTGGLQDQMGFIDEDGKYLDPDIHFKEEWGTNAEGTYKTCGPWCVPVFPTNRSLVGSPPTPYIFDDRCSYHDAAKAIRQVYDLEPDSRAFAGNMGRNWALTEYTGMSSVEMCNRMIESIDEAMTKFTPRKRFEIFKA